MSDFDKQEWQRGEAARNAALEVQREKERKARERSARNARRKLERLHRTLRESGDISDFEDEFGESVLERLDKFGAAFGDPQLGRPGDALSSAQKKVVAGMNRKVKEARRAAKAERLEAKGLAARGETGGNAEDPEGQDGRPRREAPRRYSSFKRKGPAYTPRVRQLDEDFEAEQASTSEKALRGVVEPEGARDGAPAHNAPTRPPVGKPFLRVVK